MIPHISFPHADSYCMPHLNLLSLSLDLRDIFASDPPAAFHADAPAQAKYNCVDTVETENDQLRFALSFRIQLSHDPS